MATRRLTKAQRKRHQDAADWILRRREDDFSPEERQALQDWLDGDPENLRAYKTAEQLLGDAKKAIDSDPALTSFETKPAGGRKAAARTVLGLAVIAGAFLYFDGPMRLQADVISGVADLPLIELEDGSSVHMNAGSAIAVDYTGRVRTVRLLRGEAFFEVASDPDRPFRVEAGAAQVTALGTAFDIRRGSEQTEITVTHNAVLVEVGEAGLEPLRLKEGQRIDYSGAAGRLGEITAKDAETALAWRRGLLVLDNAKLSYVIEEIQRRFSGRIVIASSGLADRRISGTIAIADTRAALAFLEQALDLNAIELGPLILLRG